MLFSEIKVFQQVTLSILFKDPGDSCKPRQSCCGRTEGNGYKWRCGALSLQVRSSIWFGKGSPSLCSQKKSNDIQLRGFVFFYHFQRTLKVK